jgi:hypothetical protein
MLYSTVTTAQYTRYLATLVCRAAPVPASPRASTWTSFLCGIEHFRALSDSPTKSLRLDRGALWRLCYPVAMSFFCLFVCIPGYDATCTCTLCAGFFLRVVHEELVRGAWFHRPISRRLLLTVLCLFGALSIVLLFALGYTTGLIVTNRGLESSRLLVDREDSTLLDALVDAGNSSSAFDDAGIIDNFIYDAEISNPDVVQYLQWTVHSYPRKMALVWFLFFLAPFMLANVPQSAPTLLVLEATHTSTTSIAAINLCCISIVLSRQPFVLLRSSNSASVAYMLLSPALTWLIIKKLIQYQRQRVLYIPLCVLVLVTFAKHCIQHKALAGERFFSDLSVVCGVLITTYAIASALFYRLEGNAVRNGWGQAHDTHVELEPEDDDDDDDDDDDNGAKFSITGEVQDVLDNAKRDLKLAERIVQASIAEGVDEEGDDDGEAVTARKRDAAGGKKTLAAGSSIQATKDCRVEEGEGTEMARRGPQGDIV